jgi:hypothetical protein
MVSAIAGYVVHAITPAAAARKLRRVTIIVQTPKSSVKIRDVSTPASSSIASTARIIKGGPHR